MLQQFQEHIRPRLGRHILVSYKTAERNVSDATSPCNINMCYYDDDNHEIMCQ